MQINSFTATGRLGREPETKFFESGANSTKFSIAVDRGGKDAPTDWFECVAWGKTGVFVGTYCKKGSLVGVTGSIYVESWEDRETGVKRQKHVVNVQQISLLGGKSDNNTSGGDSSSAGATANYDYDYEDF